MLPPVSKLTNQLAATVGSLGDGSTPPVEAPHQPVDPRIVGGAIDGNHRRTHEPMYGRGPDLPIAEMAAEEDARRGRGREGGESMPIDDLDPARPRSDDAREVRIFRDGTAEIIHMSRRMRRFSALLFSGTACRRFRNARREAPMRGPGIRPMNPPSPEAESIGRHAKIAITATSPTTSAR